MTDSMEDPEALEDQYADASNLNARIALHERYSTAERELMPWIFDQFALPDDARVLSLGCGSATLWVENAPRLPDDWEVAATDRSQGMVEQAYETLADSPEEFDFAVTDAETIPFAEERFDAVTANHMLYHVPDRKAAFDEIRRVLKPNGRLYATTNGEENMQALHDVITSVAGPYPRATAFSLENGGDQLRTVFEDVELRRYDDGLCVTEVEPLVAYALSREGSDESMAPTLHEAFAREFEDGVFRVEKDVGLFVARKQG